MKEIKSKEDMLEFCLANGCLNCPLCDGNFHDCFYFEHKCNVIRKQQENNPNCKKCVHYKLCMSHKAKLVKMLKDLNMEVHHTPLNKVCDFYKEKSN